MGANSKIEWTHHTFNAWRGCTKVSPGCKNCYAERQAKRFPGRLGIWGDEGTRVIAPDAYWRQPLAWNAAAYAAGERHRVFCLSLGDVFEDRTDLIAPRERLFELIADTPHLDWLLLTKRPQIARMLMPILSVSATVHLIDQGHRDAEMAYLDRRGALANVWLGTSVEDDLRAAERIGALVNIRAVVHFLSIEPLLGPVTLPEQFLLPNFAEDDPRYTARWVIVGGESGPGARPMHPDWVRSLRDQCQTNAAPPIPFFFKQWGEWLPYQMDAQPPFWASAADGKLIDGHALPENLADGELVDGWLAGDLTDANQVIYHRVGKQAAGRLLDGRTWDELPHVPLAPGAGGAGERARVRGSSEISNPQISNRGAP